MRMFFTVCLFVSGTQDKTFSVGTEDSMPQRRNKYDIFVNTCHPVL